MNEAEFKKIFEKCMEVNKCYIDNVVENGEVFSTVCNVEPSCTIRDFLVEMPLLSDPNFNTTFDLNKCDKEFKDFESAWEHLKSVKQYRIMDSAGNIHADNCVNF